MFGSIDKWVEKRLKKHLYLKKHYYLESALAGFEQRNPGHSSLKIRRRLEAEASRVYSMVDRSILKERIKRSKYTFWATAIVSLIVIGTVIGLTGGSAIALIAPLAAAIAAWAISIATIPISYNQRVKGAYDSVIFPYEDNLRKGLLKEPEQSKSILPLQKTVQTTGNAQQEYYRNLVYSQSKAGREKQSLQQLISNKGNISSLSSNVERNQARFATPALQIQ